MLDAMKKFGIAVLAAITGLSLIGLMASLMFLASSLISGSGTH